MISVITVTYNNYDDLHRTLHSLNNIDGIESVVVNGGNSKKTKKLLSNYDGIAISEPDKGISDAFNKGVTHATGENVMFLNSGDILLSPDYLKEAEKTLNFNPEISFVHSDSLFEDRISGIIYMEPLKSAFFKVAPLGRGMPYNHLTMVIRKNVFDKIGLFKLHYKITMDFEWVCRLQKNSYKGHYVGSRPVVRMDGGGISSTTEQLVMWESLKALKESETDIETAILLSQQSVVADPKNAKAWAIAAKIYLLNKDLSSAERFIAKAKAIDPYLKEIQDLEILLVDEKLESLSVNKEKEE